MKKTPIELIRSIFGRKKDEKLPNNDEIPVEKIRVFIKNNVANADVWIIPNTEKNRKTTVWGAATAKISYKDECTADVVLSENGEYLFRMIDYRQTFYASKCIPIMNGFSVVVSEKNEYILLEIRDINAEIVYSEEILGARL